MSFYKKKGFTLLELMIMVIIVGILASLAVPRFLTATRKAKEAEAMAILGAVRSSQMRFFLENEEVYSQDITTLDLDITTSRYFAYSAIDDGGSPPNIGQAAAIGVGLSNFRIDEDGVITSY